MKLISLQNVQVKMSSVIVEITAFVAEPFRIASYILEI